MLGVSSSLRSVVSSPLRSLLSARSGLIVLNPKSSLHKLIFNQIYKNKVAAGKAAQPKPQLQPNPTKIEPEPPRENFGLVKVGAVMIGGASLGAVIAKKLVTFLEEQDIFYGNFED